ncbi:hypothetical protein AYI69_g10176, partial [Smittium culicis]
MPIKNTGVGS